MTKFFGLHLMSIIFILFTILPHESLAQKDAQKSRLRSAGYYNTFDTSTMKCGEKINFHYRIYTPLIIINEKNAISENGGDRGSVLRSLGFYSNMKSFLKIVGTYSVSGNELFAQLPISLFLRGMRMRMLVANFRGVIKNSDTIINWRMVAPYPDAPKKFNEDFKDLIEPHLLYFVESKELEGLNDLYQERIKAQAK